MELNVGVVKVPDERLDRLAEIFKPKKIVQADVTYVDLPAPPASTEGRVGTEELPAEHLARLRDRTRCSTSSARSRTPPIPHPEGSVDPRARPRPARPRVHPRRPRARRPPARAAARRAAATARRPSASRTSARRSSSCGSRRRSRRARRSATSRSTPDEEKAIRGFRFLTQKPVLVLAERRRGRPAAGRRARRRPSPAATTTANALVDALSARIEMELGELEPDEAAVFMEELGIAESGLDRVIALSLPAARPDLVPHRRARTRSAPGRSATARRRSTPPARSTPTSRRASSAPRPSPTRTS